MREIQIKTTMRYPFTLTRIALIKKNKQKTASVSKDMEKLELLYTVMGPQKGSVAGKKKKKVWWFFKKLKQRITT